MQNDKPVLIVPVENQVRELDAKLLTACVAAERGFDVTLGSRTYVHFAMTRLRRGVFLAKSLRGISSLMFELMQRLGHGIVAWDEESLVRFSSPEYCEFRYSEQTFAALDHLFAWGEDDAALFRGYHGYTGVPIHVTGNPRMDLLRDELHGYFHEQTCALKEKFGDFILVNTNFPFVNPFAPELALLQPRASGRGMEVGRSGRGLSLEFAQGYAAHIRSIFRHFQALLPKLADWFPDRCIIVRPHPSEDHETWKRLVAQRPNVHVLHDGNVVPWLRACGALLHNGCTTAVEAAVVGKQALSYMPVTARCFDYPLPNALSHQACSESDVRECLNALLDGTLAGIDPIHRERLLGRHVAATAEPLAADRVVDVLCCAGYREQSPPRPPLHRYAAGWLGTHGRTALKLINRHRPRHRNSAAYHAHRFPEISACDLERRIRRFRALLGRFDDVSVTPHTRHLFRVTTAQPPRPPRRQAPR